MFQVLVNPVVHLCVLRCDFIIKKQLVISLLSDGENGGMAGFIMQQL